MKKIRKKDKFRGYRNQEMVGGTRQLEKKTPAGILGNFRI